MQQCPKCHGRLLLTEYPGEPYPYLKCANCGREVEQVPEAPPETPQSNSPRASGLSAAKMAEKRYRRTELFRSTNKRIQDRYRKSDKGKQTLNDANRRHQILTKLERLLEKLVPGWLDQEQE